MGPRRHVGASVIATVAIAGCVSPTRQVIRASVEPAPVATLHTVLEPDVTAPVLDKAMCRERATERLRQRVEHSPGNPAYMLVPSLTRLDVDLAQGTTVACAIEIRVTPASKNGHERWEGGKTAIAIGRALVTSTAAPHEVELSIDACVDSAAEQVLRGRVLPFLERSVAAR
jgi:hypothetical protein